MYPASRAGNWSGYQMKIEWRIGSCVALPMLALINAPHPKAAAPVQVPITGQGIDASGRKITLTGVATVTVEDPTPPPPPDPLALSYLTMAPSVVAPGGSATVGVVLTRAAGQAVPIALKSAAPDGQVAASMTIAAGQSAGTAAVTTSSSITTEKLIGIVATLNGQSKSANLTVRPGALPPPPPPPPTPLGPVTPAVDRAAWDGRAVTVTGVGFGTTPGLIWWGGYPCVVLRWSDTEAVGMTAEGWGSDYGWYALQTAAGGGCAALVSPEGYSLPPSGRRR
jgi:hypothetical protein